MNTSRYADSPPVASALSTIEQTFTPSSQEAITQSSDLPPSISQTPSAHSYPNHDADAMDEFAQTRAPDDLFDDDFTPISQPTPQQHVPTGPKSKGEPSQRGQGERRRRARSGRRGGTPEEEQVPASEGQDEAGAAKETPRGHAVRGDRSGTGGVKKPKLTEDELSARLEKLKIKNAAREAAHKRAEADEASFRQREQVAHAKRQEERQNRQVLEGERERNRQRKLKAVQGREWDAEKKEEDYNSGRGAQGSQFRRGAYGGVSYSSDGYHGRGATMIDEGAEFPSPRGEPYQRGTRGRGRGRGDGFRGRGGGRGRGGQHNGPANETPFRDRNFRNPDFGAEHEFPALPGTNSAQGGNGNQKPKSQIPPGTENKPKEEESTWESAPRVETKQEGWSAGTDGVRGDTWATDPASGGKDATWADQMITPVTPSGGW